jgi:hypothetical protein
VPPPSQLTTLIYDAPDGALGALALRLVELGLHTGYANDIDELALLAGERNREAGVGALVFPESTLHELPQLIKRVALPWSIPLETFVPVGTGLGEKERAQLREYGLRWCLVDSCTDAELRFVMELANWSTDPMNLRSEPRVPVQLPVMVNYSETSRTGHIRDLSLSGAFLTDHPFVDPGTPISLELGFDGRVEAISARVRWLRQAEGDRLGSRPAGMGVEFVDLAEGLRESMQTLLRDAQERFEI